MSKHVLAKRRDALELVERLLNKTTLSTKRLSHENIIGVGNGVMKKTVVDVDGEKEQAVKEALEKAEKRHTRELRGALHRQERKLNENKEKELKKQKTHYDDLARRVAEQRDRAEEERARELRRLFDKEKEDALNSQWEECERLKEKAIEEACIALRKQLRDEFAWEKERCIGEALARAREKFYIREQATIARTQEECRIKYEEIIDGIRKAHAKEMTRQQAKYDVLNRKYHKELRHKQRVEEDFRALQTDYQRFMDYTDGKYNSDYMMNIRHHGIQLTKKKVSVVSYEDIEMLIK